jgi:hypothetical protein
MFVVMATDIFFSIMDFPFCLVTPVYSVVLLQMLDGKIGYKYNHVRLFNSLLNKILFI